MKPGRAILLLFTAFAVAYAAVSALAHSLPRF